jgi:DNA-binding CsgD family transcriptional regulator
VREVQVACLLVQRMTNEEIAGALGISTHTARHHTESVLLKAGVNSRRALHSILRGD